MTAIKSQQVKVTWEGESVDIPIDFELIEACEQHLCLGRLMQRIGNKEIVVTQIGRVLHCAIVRSHPRVRVADVYKVCRDDATLYGQGVELLLAMVIPPEVGNDEPPLGGQTQPSP